MNWSCAETRNVIARGELPSVDAALEHLADCDHCSELVERQARAWIAEPRLAPPSEVAAATAPASSGAFETTHASASAEPAPQSVAGPPMELDELFERVSADVRRDAGPLGWLRSRPTSHRVGAVLVVVALLVVAQVVRQVRADILVYPAARLAVEVTLLALVTLGGIRAALHPMQRLHRPAATWLWLALALAVPLAVALGGPAHEGHPDSLAGVGSEFWPRAAACFGFGLAMAVPAWLALALLDRRAAASLPIVLLCSTLGGLVGNLILQLHCPITAPAHLLVGHATVGLALVPLGWLVVSWRGRDPKGRRARGTKAEGRGVHHV